MSRNAYPQVQALSKLKTLDPDKCNIVRWHKHFSDRGCICLEFEYLEKSLSDFMKQRYYRPLFVKEIRPIVQQVIKSLIAGCCFCFFPQTVVALTTKKEKASLCPLSLPTRWNT